MTECLHKVKTAGRYNSKNAAKIEKVCTSVLLRHAAVCHPELKKIQIINFKNGTFGYIK